MIFLLLICLTIISVISVATHSLFTISYTNLETAKIVSEQDNLRRWETSITNNAFLNSAGDLMVPLGNNIEVDLDGDTNTDRFIHTLPSGFGLPIKNGWGNHYRYCPLGTAQMTINAPDETVYTGKDSNMSYGVTIVEHNGNEFAAQSTFIPDATIASFLPIAYIISPFNDEFNLGCDAVTYDPTTGKADIDNGVVRAIFKNDVYLSAHNTLAYNVETVDEFLKYNEEYYQNNPDFFQIGINNDLEISHSISFCDPFSDRSGDLRLVGKSIDGQNTKLTAKNGYNPIMLVCNTNVHFGNLDVNFPIININTSIMMHDFKVAELVANYSDVSASGSLVIEPVELDQSSLHLYHSTFIPQRGTELVVGVNDSLYGVHIIESQVTLEDVNFHVFSQPLTRKGNRKKLINQISALLVGPYSNLSLKKTQFSVNIKTEGDVIRTHGITSLISANVIDTVDLKSRYDHFISLFERAVLNIDGSAVLELNGNRYAAFRDYSGTSITGSDATIKTGHCWTGPLFYYLSNHKPTSSHNPYNNNQNHSTWDCI